MTNINIIFRAKFHSSEQDEARYAEELVSLFKGLKASVSDRLKRQGASRRSTMTILLNYSILN